MELRRKHTAMPLLRGLYGTCDRAFIKFRFTSSNQSGLFPLLAVDSISDALNAHKDEEIYFSIATRKNLKDKEGANYQIPALWMTIDGKSDVLWSSLKRLDERQLPPNFLLNNGRYNYLFWLLEHPATRNQIPKVEEINKELAFDFGGEMNLTHVRNLIRLPEKPNLIWFGKKRKYTLGDFDRLTPATGTEQPTLGEKEGEKVSYQLVTLKDISNYPDPTYLIKPILVEGTVSILGAYPGTGKSVLTLSIIKSILTGEPLWGKFPINKCGKILLIDEETPKPWLKQNIKRMGFEENVHFFALHFQGVRLDDDAYFDALMEKIKEVRPVLTIFDSMIRFHRQHEQDASSMSLVMSRLRKIANSGTTVLVLHHHKKGGKKTEKSRGSTDILAGIDVEFSLTETKDKKRLIFESVKSRTKRVLPITLRKIFTKKRIELIYEGQKVSDEAKTLAKAKEVLKNGEAGVKEILEAFKEVGFKMAEQRLRNLLNENVKNGTFTERKVGPKKKVYGLKLMS